MVLFCMKFVLVKSTGYRRRLYGPPSGSRVTTVHFLLLCCRWCLFIRDSVEQTALDGISLGYDKHPRQTDDSIDSSVTADEEKLDLELLLKKDSLCSDSKDDGTVADKTFVSMMIMITVVGHKVSVSKDDYVNLVHTFATKV